jgi:hypothetical protein
MAKCALVWRVGGFIGGHLVKRLKRDDFWIRGVDLKFHEFSQTEADDFRRRRSTGSRLLSRPCDRRFDEVYHLAADMGEAPAIFSPACVRPMARSAGGGTLRCRRWVSICVRRSAPWRTDGCIDHGTAPETMRRDLRMHHMPSHRTSLLILCTRKRRSPREPSFRPPSAGSSLRSCAGPRTVSGSGTWSSSSLNGDDGDVLDSIRVSRYSRPRRIDDQIVSGNRKDTLIVGIRRPE